MPTRRYTVAHHIVIALTAGYLLAAAAVAFISGNGEFVFYLVVMLLLVAAVYAIDRRVHFSIGVLACLSAWGAMHMAGGLVPVPESWPINGEQRVLYSWWVVPFVYADSGQVAYGLKYDHLTHAYGFGVTCWACWQGLCATVRSAMRDAGGSEDVAIAPTSGRLTLCLAAALGFGALNEVVEFIATTLGPTNVGGYTNTGYDLIANTVGAVITVIAIRFSSSAGRSPGPAA